MTTMLPERWKESIEQARDKFGNFLERLKPVRDQNNGPEHVTADFLPAFMQTGGPLLDMYETGAEMVVSVDVPGLEKNEISVELVGKRLIVRGEKQVSRERRAGGGLYSVNRYGSFTRNLQLPCEVDDRSINANLKHGVLTIRLPKPESKQNRQHRVTVS